HDPALPPRATTEHALPDGPDRGCAPAGLASSRDRRPAGPSRLPRRERGALDLLERHARSLRDPAAVLELGLHLHHLAEARGDLQAHGAVRGRDLHVLAVELAPRLTPVAEPDRRRFAEDQARDVLEAIRRDEDGQLRSGTLLLHVDRREEDLE